MGGPNNIIGSDLSRPGAGLLGGMEVEGDEFADIEGQTAGLGVLSGLTKIFGPKIGTAIFNRGRKKVILIQLLDAQSKKLKQTEQLQEAKTRAETKANKI